jgi:hypothetical protein
MFLFKSPNPSPNGISVWSMGLHVVCNLEEFKFIATRKLG